MKFNPKEMISGETPAPDIKEPSEEVMFKDYTSQVLSDILSTRKPKSTMNS